MSSVEQHYDGLLAPVYAWMVGGAEVAFDTGQADLAAFVPEGSLAVDLGAGFGMHTIPLARLGWRVIAFDSSPLLIKQLSESAQGLPVETHCADLLDFEVGLGHPETPNLIVCMGDTLTHLHSMELVVQLVGRIGSRLCRGGRFIATFRDYSELPVGDRRFIPVRSDEHRILTCFLEDEGQHVRVHDLLHEEVNGKWQTKISSYRKLRLQPGALLAACTAAGLRATIVQGPRGMLRLLADA
jgi:SAM-dependent methyltransferase